MTAKHGFEDKDRRGDSKNTMTITDSVLASLFDSANAVSAKEVISGLENENLGPLMRQLANLDALLVVCYAIDANSLPKESRKSAKHSIAEAKSAIFGYHKSIAQIAKRYGQGYAVPRKTVAQLMHLHKRAMIAGRGLYDNLMPDAMTYYDLSMGTVNG